MAQKCRNLTAINLKSYNLCESDKIVVMYSKEEGLIRCVAKGCKKAKSKLGARMDLLVANDLFVSEGRNMGAVREARTVNSFLEIRKDISKLMYSSYVAEIVCDFGVENDPCSEEIYNLLYCALERISSAKNKIDVLIAVMKFQLKFMNIAGFGLELKKCPACETVVLENMYFSVKHGGVLCPECAELYGVTTKFHYKLRDFLLALYETDFDKSCSYEEKATEHVCEVCLNLLKNYVQMHCSKKIKSAEMLSVI